MIVVVEGISASGKSRFAAGFGPAHVVAEHGRIAGVPDGEAAALFWADRNEERWRTALAVERATGLAVCDTDPLKLHYVWTLWRIGAAPERDWLAQLAAARRSFAAGRIGFANAYCVRRIDPAQARRRRDGDPTRTRRNFDLHVRLQAPLLAWYAAIDAVLPGRVRFDFPAGAAFGVEGAGDEARYDLARFDAFVARLPAAA